MSGSGGNGSQVLQDVRGALAGHRQVNLTGPLGVGKSHLLAHLDGVTRVDLDAELPSALGALRRHLAHPAAARRTLVVDSVDGSQRVAAVSAALHDARDRHPALVVVSRQPLAMDPRWTHTAVAVAVAPACEERITAMTADIREPGLRALLHRLAGGIPLLADTARRALACGADCEPPGAVADRLAQVVLERLGRELPGQRWRHALRMLATMRTADERLLPGGPDQFSRLAALSIVHRDALGLRIAEPYRTVLELAYHWRRPEAHEDTRTRARDYRLTLLRRARDGHERAALADQMLFLTGDPLVRRELFPAGDRAVGFRVACAADEDDIARLMDRWARHSGFDPRRSARLTERWAGHDISTFHLAHDRDGRPIGVANLLPIGEQSADCAEPLMQQHSGMLAGGGLFLGAAHCDDSAARALLLRHVLRQGVVAGRLVVSTASPDYQELVRGLGFRMHGAIHDDVYRCGHRPQVFSNDLGAPDLPGWLERVGSSDGSSGGPPPEVPHLAPKELRVLLAYASGLTLESAARRAGIAPNTAKYYLTRVKAKYLAVGRPTHTKIDLARRVREDELDRA
ncbi:hypothetical protein [Streptomyces yangpuensis]|uniref:hypothetical protein n=1 Tax=Streptomyces yangpuensis TaxID=1648182 RepID=UPI0037F9ACBD